MMGISVYVCHQECPVSSESPVSRVPMCSRVISSLSRSVPSLVMPWRLALLLLLLPPLSASFAPSRALVSLSDSPVSLPAPSRLSSALCHPLLRDPMVVQSACCLACHQKMCVCHHHHRVCMYAMRACMCVWCKPAHLQCIFLQELQQFCCGCKPGRVRPVVRHGMRRVRPSKNKSNHFFNCWVKMLTPFILFNVSERIVPKYKGLETHSHMCLSGKMEQHCAADM